MIAIVGMGLRLPGGIQTPAALWRALHDGRDLVGPLPEARRPDFPKTDQPFPREAGYLHDVAGFDAKFFGINGLEASYMDPQQRLLLETTWSAFEDAAIRPSSLGGKRVGVFAGAHACDYLEVCANMATEIKAYWISGLNTSVLANRISHWFDFTGPSLTVNTACSSGLEALHLAVDALSQRRCEVALATAANLILSPSITVSAARSGILSAAARCRTFDARADGFVRGEGVISLVLKPLDRALADGDPIYACIRSSVSRHQGRAQSLTAPSLRAQRDLVVDAVRQAAIDPATIAAIEAHGTATPLGDSVEIEALKEAFHILAPDLPAASIGLGSIKTNIGHLEAAAGLAGVVKACLALDRGVFPRNIHFEALHPLLDLSGSPLKVAGEQFELPSADPVRIGVSSFGFGGTGCHVILEASPASKAKTQPLARAEGGAVPILISAATESALNQRFQQIQSWLTDHDTSLSDVAATLALGRDPLPHRLAILASSVQELQAALAKLIAGEQPDVIVYQGSGKVKSSGQIAKNDPGTIAKAFAETGVQPTERSGTRQRLPTYPFQPKRYWVKPGKP